MNISIKITQILEQLKNRLMKFLKMNSICKINYDLYAIGTIIFFKQLRNSKNQNISSNYFFLSLNHYYYILHYKELQKELHAKLFGI